MKLYKHLKRVSIEKCMSDKRHASKKSSTSVPNL